MDGPFRLELRLHGNLLYIIPDDHSWQCNMLTETFVHELLAATKRVQQKFADLGVSDQEGLQIGIQHLKAAMSQAKMTVSPSHRLVVESVAH